MKGFFMIKNFLTLIILVSASIFTSVSYAKIIFPLGAAQFQLPVNKSSPASGLKYYGGPVIEQVKGVTVFWNRDVDSETQRTITNFYRDYVNSQHMDWLNEYSTNINAMDGRKGTNQTIRRGSWLGEVTLNPSITKRNLQDEEIQSEIEKQIDLGFLPLPDANTLYALHFPSNIQITIEGMSSCISFGGYHYFFKSQKYGNIYYTVIPTCSFRVNSQKEMDSLQSTTFVASHEIIEAITDAMPTAGSNPAYPQAWTTTGAEEIADICQHGLSFSFPTGTYYISYEWSNSRNRCYDGR